MDRESSAGRAASTVAPTTVLVVIVNYRIADLVIDCLRSLETEVGAVPGARVVVTDNASGDDSVARLVEAVRENGWEGWAAIQPLERNGGFAYGNNEGIRPALQAADRPRYVLLLNPDTVVRPGALKTLVDFLESRPDVGLAGSRLEHPDATPQRSAFRFPSVLGELERGMRLGLVTRLLARWVIAPPIPQQSGSADWVSGACLIVRREVFEMIGLLDEGYFMYYEEVDFCLRARRAGWPCWYLPGARVVHLVGQSASRGASPTRRPRQPDYWFHSRRRYFLAHLGPFRTLLADLAWSLGFLSFRVRQVIQCKPDADPPGLLRDFIRHNFLTAGR
jgi:N-acetylglucosaminyl-diphospho-decaprenol L-rhamnosyltransferase